MFQYYFGDANLPRDKFLQEQIKLEDGWVPLEVMLRFQRLAQLTKNPSTIVSCLKSDSKLMEVSVFVNCFRFCIHVHF